MLFGCETNLRLGHCDGQALLALFVQRELKSLVQGSGFRAQDLGSRDWVSGFRVRGSGIGVWGVGVLGLGHGVQGFGS